MGPMALKMGALILVLVIVSACDSASGGQTATSEVIPTETATASPTVPPTATATPRPSTPTPNTRDSIPVDSIVTPICLPADPNGPDSVGTAPGAQPTATPSQGERDETAVRLEITAYLERVSPVIDHTLFWEDWLIEEWQEDSSPEEAAALLHIMGTKIAQACSSLALIGLTPPETSDLHAAISEATLDRLSWISTAATQLKSGSSTEQIVEASTVIDLMELVSSELQSLTAAYPGINASVYSLTDSVLLIEVAMPDGWFVSPDNLNLALIASPESGGTDLASLGPESWGLGSSVRVRRLRNAGSLTPEQASSLFNGIVTRQGEIASSENIELSGYPAIRHHLMTGNSWAASVTVVIAGEFTYFLETGCLATVNGGCEAVESVVNSIEFLEN